MCSLTCILLEGLHSVIDCTILSYVTSVLDLSGNQMKSNFKIDICCPWKVNFSGSYINRTSSLETHGEFGSVSP